MTFSARQTAAQPLAFRIHCHGIVGATWISTLQDVTVSTREQDGVTETALVGHVPDEAALIGILNLLYQLGCSLISVETSREAGFDANAEANAGAGVDADSDADSDADADADRNGMESR